MDRYALRRDVERAFSIGNKADLYKNIKSEDIHAVIDILWEYMNEADDGIVARRELQELQEKIKALNNKSGQRVRCLQVLKDRRALVQLGPLKEEVMISPTVDISKLKLGTEVLVIGGPEGRLIAAVRDPSIYDGRLSKIQRIIDNQRVVIDDNGNQIILKVADWVRCKDGDEIRYDLESQMVLEVISSKENSAYILSNMPSETFDDVKGLDEEKKYLYERVIYPAVYREKFEKYGIKPIRGAILHGPPGCGKTFIAGAVFNEMIKIKQKQCATLKEKTDYGGFFVINGPEVLNKWAGNTESTIRKIFEDAREAAKMSGFPSIIFWDEIESITGKRKDTATYTPEKTVVPTLLAELQGVERDNDVILIGATNRPDLIDPALMRPGRLGDAIIEIPRPDKDAARQILTAKFTKKQIPKTLEELVQQGLVEKLVEHVYDNTDALASAKTQSGNVVQFMRQQMTNGALFANIGDELIRKSCILEINNDEQPVTIENTKQMIDNILLMQLGILDAGAKSGFEFNVSDYIIDVSLNA